MQAWHGLSKYNSATAVSNSIILNLKKKSQINLKKNYIKIEIINVSK
jgi:hypothetical protein